MRLIIITIDDAAYPARLRTIFDPPSRVYVRGELHPADVSAVAIVGARRATEYGRGVTEELARSRHMRDHGGQRDGPGDRCRRASWRAGGGGGARLPGWGVVPPACIRPSTGGWGGRS